MAQCCAARDFAAGRAPRFPLPIVFPGSRDEASTPSRLMACDPAILQEIQLFELLSPKDRRALADVVGYQQIPAGTVLFRTGDPGESLFVVRSGEIELFIKDNLGQKITL